MERRERESEPRGGSAAAARRRRFSPPPLVWQAGERERERIGIRTRGGGCTFRGGTLLFSAFGLSGVARVLRECARDVCARVLI